jgi:MSHA pilin protein MshD
MEQLAMLNKPCRGMTLVELIIAMVILSIGVSGILVVYQTTTRDSANPALQKQLVAVAEGMMEEIQRMPFAPSAPTPAAGCVVRSAHNDVRDYNGYDCNDASDMLGNVQLTAYRVQVAVTNDAGLAPLPAADVYHIRVTVTAAGSSLSLDGWRTNYAQLIP